jgi:D-glycero-D-manno-heptose 1,7-bisphosphate phosphatase
MSLAVFLDRDGTVNEEVNFLSDPSELHLIDGAATAIREANALGLKVIITTNQSGVARGFLTEEQLQTIHERLREMLSREGASVDAIYYCPHYPAEGNSPYLQECSCRKPNPGMVLQAKDTFDIDLAHSFVVGDRLVDIQMGKSIGATTIIVRTGYGNDEIQLMQQQNVVADYIAENLLDAMQYIKRILQTQRQTIE